jgi:SAM-dependent methyltransferase
MSTTIQQPRATEQTPTGGKRRLTAEEIRALDPYQLMAELGKGGCSTEALLAMADPRPGDWVLDAGGGIGTTAARVARRFNCEVVALDINEANLDRARCTVQQVRVDDRVEVRRGDIEQLAFEDESFDVVIIEAVTMFVHRKRAAAEVVRVCRRGGRVVDHEFIWRKPPPPGRAGCSWAGSAPASISTPKTTGPRCTAQRAWGGCRTTTGPFAMMTSAGFLRDEGALDGALDGARFIRGAVSRPAYLRKLGWLVPGMMRAMPYLGYVVVGGKRV